MAASISELADQTFDYVVVGGGVRLHRKIFVVNPSQLYVQTAGLTVSARLAEHQDASVAVLEAGEANLDDPLIMLGGQFAATWGNPKAGPSISPRLGVDDKYDLGSTTGIDSPCRRNTRTIANANGQAARVLVRISCHLRLGAPTDPRKFRTAGGSSGMNFATWSMPHSADVDAWEKLGNDGWNWDTFHAYAKRVEQYVWAVQSPEYVLKRAFVA